MIYIGVLIVVVVQGQPPPESEPEVTPQPERFEVDGSDGSAYGFLAKCEKCGWMNSYPTASRAKQALGGHGRFCRGAGWRVSPFSIPVKRGS